MSGYMYVPPVDQSLDAGRQRNEDWSAQVAERPEDWDPVYAAHRGEPWALRDQPVPGLISTPIDTDYDRWAVVPFFHRTRNCPACWGEDADPNWRGSVRCQWHGDQQVKEGGK